MDQQLHAVGLQGDGVLGVKHRADHAVEGREDHALAGNHAYAFAQDAAGEGLVGDLLHGDDLAGHGLQHGAVGAADHGSLGGLNGGSGLHGSLLGLLLSPEDEGHAKGHAAGDE